MDVVLAAALLAVSLPVLCLAGLAIVLSTRQNPLVVQLRVGLRGREFGMLKLRTMDHRGAQGTLERLLPGETLVVKHPDDERVTRVGRWLRASSIDELPQLVNVLAGTMSLVGPRPALPLEVARYPASWRRRLDVKPGLTGLWQVSGRCEVEPNRRAAMDRYYVARRGVGLDCSILLRTARAVVSMRGAW